MVYRPDTRVSDLLRATAQEYREEYLDYLQLQNAPEDSEIGEEGRAFMQYMHAFGTELHSSLFSLTISKSLEKAAARLAERFGPGHSLPPGGIRRLIMGFGTVDLFLDHLRLSVALNATEELIPSAEDRIPQLLELVLARDLSERAAAYLDRATRTYLWGFDVECVVMCHSVLEAALSDRFPDEEVWALGIAKQGAEYTSTDYIRAAVGAKVLTREGADGAHRLRRARNDLIHAAPGASTLQGGEALQILSTLLGRLFPASPE